jgi:hypothetical protein
MQSVALGLELTSPMGLDSVSIVSPRPLQRLFCSLGAPGLREPEVFSGSESRYANSELLPALRIGGASVAATCAPPYACVRQSLTYFFACW